MQNTFRILTVLILVTVMSIGFTGEVAASLSASMIKDALKRDFGYEVDIAGGAGRSRTEPMIINASSPDQAAETELLVLRGLGRGRNIFWRSLGINIVKEQDRNLVQRIIETKEFTDDEIITQTEGYYFSRANSSVSELNSDPIRTVHTDPLVGIKFPSEISWLHYSNFADHEVKQPGLGYSLAYNGPAFTSSIFVYPINDRKPSCENEIKSAIEDVVTIYGKDAIEHDWGITEEHDHSFYFFIPEYKPKYLSGIVVTSLAGYFIKVRMTFFDDPVYRIFSGEFATELLNLVRRTNFAGMAPKE